MRTTKRTWVFGVVVSTVHNLLDVIRLAFMVHDDVKRKDSEYAPERRTDPRLLGTRNYDLDIPT